MGEVRWGWRKKNDHPPLTPPIKGGEKGRRRLNLIVYEFSFYLCGLYDVWHRESPLVKGARGL